MDTEEELRDYIHLLQEKIWGLEDENKSLKHKEEILKSDIEILEAKLKKEDL